MSVNIKRIFKIQVISIHLMMDTIDALKNVIAKYYDELPKDMVKECSEILGTFLYHDARINKAREHNISGFYNKLRNKFEDDYKLE